MVRRAKYNEIQSTEVTKAMKIVTAQGEAM